MMTILAASLTSPELLGFRRQPAEKTICVDDQRKHCTQLVVEQKTKAHLPPLNNRYRWLVCSCCFYPASLERPSSWYGSSDGLMEHIRKTEYVLALRHFSKNNWIRHIHFSRSNLAGDGIVQMRVVIFQWVKVLRHHLSINETPIQDAPVFQLPLVLFWQTVLVG